MLEKMINSDAVEAVRCVLDNGKRFVVLAHKNPDGDAVGSSLALCHYISGLGKEAVVVLPNAFPEFLAWLPGAGNVLFYDSNSCQASAAVNDADAVFCLDFNSLSRVGDLSAVVAEAAATRVLVDHHLSPEHGFDIEISHPQACSTSELIYRLIESLSGDIAVTYDIARCIYTGMMTDTGGFTYNSNDREIYYIISELLSKGIDKDEIYRKVFNTYSEGRLRLMGYVLYDKMQVFPEFNAALIWLNKDEQKRFQYSKGDTEGFVNMPLSIKNVCFSAFLREDTEKKMIKVSLRSVGTFPCNKVAAEFFNGGGHLNASGGEFYGTMDEAIAVFKQALVRYQELLLSKK